jgi:hypothetical protein
VIKTRAQVRLADRIKRRNAAPGWQSKLQEAGSVRPVPVAVQQASEAAVRRDSGSRGG